MVLPFFLPIVTWTKPLSDEITLISLTTVTANAPTIYILHLMQMFQVT